MYAYQQVVPDEKSRPHITIPTHLRLYAYTRLPFGVAATHEIFQQLLDTLGQTRGTDVALIITGENNEQ